MQLIAKRYIEENDLERIISEMLNSLVHERVKQPLVYMIKYLAGLMTEEERKINGLIIPEPFPIGQPIAKYPYLSHDSLLKKYLSKELFKDIKYLKIFLKIILDVKLLMVILFVFFLIYLLLLLMIIIILIVIIYIKMI